MFLKKLLFYSLNSKLCECAYACKCVLLNTNNTFTSVLFCVTKES